MTTDLILLREIEAAKKMQRESVDHGPDWAMTLGNIDKFSGDSSQFKSARRERIKLRS